MKSHRKLILFSAGALLLAVGAFLFFSAGGDERHGLSEGSRKAFIERFKDEGERVESALQAEFPKDEDTRMKTFRARIEALQQTLLADYGLSSKQADAVYREARKKGWW